MGGDFAPAEQVKGAVEAVNENPNVCVKLFGIEEKVNAELSKYTYKKEQIEVIHAPTVIETAEPPVKAIKTKKDSSMVTAMYAVKNGEADAMVSCGSTGALLVGGQVIVGRIRGIERGALAFMVPTLKGMTLIIDCGANVDARADMLVQFAQMGSIYMECMMGIKNPRVGIINIGEEEEKGNALVKETFPLLKECKGINFVGSVEGRGIPEGEVDVAVCDAFTGNVFLKTYEGVSSALITKIKGSLMTSLKTKIGGLLIKKDLKNMLKDFSSEAYGGAPMLGLKNLVVKPHGSSKSVEIKNAILQCVSFAEADISAKIAANLELNKEAAEA
ncbi:MAG: phosphate acyltransferase PlsX [Lachnospiraceae bacterium]|nr:phosphate acyltransferase PlsX [Lachnospiraceae bacterium]